MKKTPPKKSQNGPSARAELLRESGLKITPARLQVIAILEKSSVPMAIDDLCAKVKDKADQATVYRTINTLCTEGLVRQIDLHHGHAYYELNSAGDHHHIVCTSCGLIEDFDGCHGDKLAKAALTGSKQFVEISEHALELFGLCKKCAKQRK